MTRLPLLLAGLFTLAAVAPAQSPPAPEPTIDINASGGSAAPGSNTGTSTVSGKVNLPPGWKITVHTLTLRYRQAGGSASLNVFAPVKGSTFTFEAKIELPTGSYDVQGLIDVKDAAGREKQITSGSKGVVIR
ncbi:MAG TPA: hypothetical protein VKD90_20845 [Gemmataceae bacterium]|nr:hypothetical protein [Gemmataceae bacterium]